MIDQEKDLKFMTCPFLFTHIFTPAIKNIFVHFQGKNIPFSGYMQHLFHGDLRLGTIYMQLLSMTGIEN